MHVIFRETHGLEEMAVPKDLGQTPADLVVLSFSDSDLGAFAAGWRRAQAAGSPLSSLRLANLSELTHPLSVDTYVEKTLSGAKAILIRLIGGSSYWAYGLQQVEALARTRGIALAVLPADGRIDTRLNEFSTLPGPLLHELAQLCDAGGEVAAQMALTKLALATGLESERVQSAHAVATVGAWHADEGITCPAAFALTSSRPKILLVFYRAYLTAADLHPFEVLHAAFRKKGFDVLGLFAPSLKDPSAREWLERWVQALAPVAIVNATAFSARGEDGATPLDAAGVPVFQLALATSGREAWEAASRGLSPADLAMHIVLPEVDGRLFAGVASFKQTAIIDADLEYARSEHRAEPSRINAIVERITAWVRLGQKAADQRRLALILSTYPGKDHQMAHAVGLDALASAKAILHDLSCAGYVTDDRENLAIALQTDRLSWSLEEYREALKCVPDTLRAELSAAWGEPEDDPSALDGKFIFAALQAGAVTIALQPERGMPHTRGDDYHDLSRLPRHAYVAFYLWLREQGIDALLHIGAHGTLEWLPGKSVALSDTCWPEILLGPTPVIYPFIVNDPGEAAQAKRRIGAVTLGHVPPPMKVAEGGMGLARIEALLDEFSNADGLDPARRNRLQSDIRSEAQALGLEEELGLDSATTTIEAISRIDRFVCDVKESQFGDGLHIFGRGEHGDAERNGLLTALAGRRIAPGPSGSPFRGRSDVLPTGRNLYTIDPRAVPSRAAHEQGVKVAEELIRRHLQDHGDYPRRLVVDLWGSATMRTAGEEFAMALHLLGAKPVWDMTSERVSGVEILPLVLFDRPRIDVTLRVSGLFRDAFPTLPALFGQAVRALCARDEPPEWNPFAGRAVAPRVYGPQPGSYGLNVDSGAFSVQDRLAAGRAWLAASSHALDMGSEQFDPDGLRLRVASADAFVHLQDLPETDLLLAADYAAHEAGFAAAQLVTGGSASLYHLDARNPEQVSARTLTEEIARVVRARAAHPDWVAGMMRHGFRGGAELAATLDHLGMFAHLAGAVPSHLIDLYHDATMGREEVRDFLTRENPGALAAMQAGFSALHAAGLWRTRRNSILASLESQA
ncbi:cobaltochelatase subunit CobN [Rhizorhapis suberifaciens]|uniref:Cobaltochelatase CobN n=1 Tax=Rhizorhapis suberifaciens TaxID=13656 RepID=A0A840HQQ7_9SPHN|nr:cobaltochelatase subunit CobN [Rhizorhapis suberifaciens]MBB4640402.1 cobaltochelatase CobN [Rhizorhapis suberifaciens]